MTLVVVVVARAQQQIIGGGVNVIVDSVLLVERQPEYGK